MTSLRPRLTLQYFKSRVAQRIFLLFILCALLPVGALALFSFLQVRGHLATEAERRLHQAAKAAGMTIIERLDFLENDLHVVLGSLPPLPPGAEGLAASLPDDMKKRLGDRFRSLVIQASNGRAVTSIFGTAGPLPAFDLEQRRHIESGRSLVTSGRGIDGDATVFIARLVDPAVPEKGILFGEPNPDYLWGGDGFLSPPAELVVLGPAHELLFSSQGTRPAEAVLQAATTGDAPAGRFEWSDGRDSYVANYWTLFMRPVFFNSWVLVQSENRDDVMEPLRTFSRTFLAVVLLTVWVALLLSLRQIRRSTGPIEILKDATQKIKDRQYSHRVRIDSGDEYAELGASFNAMTESMEHHERVMGAISRIGISLTAENDDTRLLEIILHGAQAVFHADGAVLYLMALDDRLELSMLDLKSLGLHVDRSDPAALQRLGLSDGFDAGEAWAAAGATARTIAADDVYEADGGGFSAQIEIDRRTGYRSRSFMSVPLTNHERDVIGLLQLINGHADSDGGVTTFSEEDQRLAESLASQAAVALTKNRLVDDFKGLFEGLTEMIGEAIDQKSPYTGGHVRRVADLAMMIADAARHGPNEELREFAESESARYELRVAALLHDCGKITTPVHVQDKATKLETIWDRIALIETRAEIVRRERRIKLLEETVRELSDGRAAPLLSGVEQRAETFDRQLEGELALLRKCNRGREHMPETLREKVRAINRQYTYADARQVQQGLISPDELRHLLIPSGTLSPEERAIIDGHVVSTIRLLEKLPYPKRLRNVPRAAGSHHEHMDGTGYPLRLKRDEIPIAGRIIGIADIFEALTARDRPYKKAKSLPEALRILSELARTGHIDPDIYNLFVTEQVYLRYVEHRSGTGTVSGGARNQAAKCAADEAAAAPPG